jgi:hypothetical protein
MVVLIGTMAESPMGSKSIRTNIESALRILDGIGFPRQFQAPVAGFAYVLAINQKDHCCWVDPGFVHGRNRACPSE